MPRGLFHRAIGQSGGCFGPMAHLNRQRGSLESAEKTGEALAARLGCDKAADPLEALRAKTPDELLAVAGGQARTRACVDGWVFPEDIYETYAAGRQNAVPVMIGSNADEATSLSNPALIPKTVDAFQAAAKGKFDDLADEFLKVYPLTSDSDVRDAYLHSMRDEWFTWEMRTWARLTAQAKGKAFLYYFSHVPPRPDRQIYGAYHAAEIAYVFDNLARLPLMFEPVDRSLAEAMSDCWVRFATTGDPNGGTLASWKAYDPQDEPYLEFGDAIAARQGLLRAECDFFDAYAAAQRARLSK
jgi:para-nitrobenzyl esterase